MSEQAQKVRETKGSFLVIWRGHREEIGDALEVNRRLNSLWAQGQLNARGFLCGHEPWRKDQ